MLEFITRVYWFAVGLHYSNKCDKYKALYNAAVKANSVPKMLRYGRILTESSVKAMRANKLSRGVQD
jgi:hypothetical protein